MKLSEAVSASVVANIFYEIKKRITFFAGSYENEITSDIISDMVLIPTNHDNVNVFATDFDSFIIKVTVTSSNSYSCDIYPDNDCNYG